ncbi:MAG: phosphohydrolase, partial [Verrucomicrobiales bacterium]|nr:phosphohydrolase [Verrucomicrobiales bacterium]
MATCLLFAHALRGQVIVADNFNVTASGTGFALGSGVNSGINPPTTRLTGTAAANLRYISRTTRANSSQSISGSKLRVTYDTASGRFVLSADGTTPFNFASALGTAAATPANPIVYDLTISMANNSTNISRFSFALGTAEGDATTWDFGIQVFATADVDTFYTIGKRIDTKACGLTTDINTFITNTAPGTFGSEVTMLMRVTDAGSESSAYHSRVQLSFDGGFTWFYDTDTDVDLPNGWRLNGTGRYIMWDIAGNAGPVTYDNFSLRLVPFSTKLVSPAANASNVTVLPQLKAVVSNTAPGNVTVTYYGRQPGKPFPGPDFMMAVMPDTQNYAREASSIGDATKEMWFSQTEWIITNRVPSNIVYAVELGDCVNDGDIFNGGNNSTQWRNATNAMWRLESRSRTLLNAGIPYGVVVGNH